MNTEALLEKNYPTSQSVNSIVLRLLWESCRENLPEFAAFKAKYTDQFIDDRIAELDAADALPSEEARALAHIRLRNDIIELGKGGRKSWQSLKLYIKEYAVDLDAELNAAGWAEYEPASNENFSSLKSLLLKGSQYIAANATALSGDGQNMPAGFPASYNLKMTAVNNKVQEFYASIEASRVATAIKVDAYAKCYLAGVSMGTDGQHLFMDNEEMRKQFSYEAVTNVVEPPGASNLLVDVTAGGVKLQGAEVSIIGTSKSGVTNADGATLLTQLHDGPVRCRIVCDGYPEKIVDITLTAGSTSRLHVTLEPLFAGAMNVGSEQTEGSAASSEQGK
jgi:hypothetical protein